MTRIELTTKTINVHSTVKSIMSGIDREEMIEVLVQIYADEHTGQTPYKEVQHINPKHIISIIDLSSGKHS